MGLPQQDEFLFLEGDVSHVSLPNMLSDLIVEVTRLWGLPLYRKARFVLKNHGVPEISGRLELSSPPDLPLNPKQILHLKVSGVDFTSQHITAWTLLE